MPNVTPISFEMAEKKMYKKINKQTERQTFSYFRKDKAMVNVRTKLHGMWRGKHRLFVCSRPINRPVRLICSAYERFRFYKIRYGALPLK